MLLRNLKTKFIIYIIPLILFISLFFLVFFVNRLNYLIKQELTELGFSLVRDLSYSSELAVASEDETLLLPFLKGVFTQRDVVLVTVYNEKGNIIASRKKVEIEEKISKEVMETLEREKNLLKRTSFTQKGEEIYDFFSPVLIGEILAPTLGAEERKLAGFARVGLSLERIVTESRSILLFGFGITTLVILLGLGISVFLAEKMTMPVKQLTEGAGIIGKGNLKHRIKIKTGDEIEDLASSFNQMAENLEQSRAALEEAKTALEIKVVARTKELEELARSLEEKVKERTKDLEKAKKSLEIKVKERTKELEEERMGLEGKVKERTAELEKSKAALTEMLAETEEARKALLNILEDVAEAREKIEEEKNKTLGIITNFTDGLLVLNPENKVSLINSQAEHFLGIEAKEIVGRSILELSNFPQFKSLTDLLGREIRKIFRKELPIKENLILEVSTLPIMSGRENQGTLVIFHDVTREKTIEKLKTEFVSLAAHQLRTPLSAIKWILRTILDGDAGKVPKEQQELLEKGYKSNERMIALINDLLNVARIEEGRFLYNFTYQSIEEIIEKAVARMEELVKKKKVKINFQKPAAPLPQVRMDAEKIELVVQNLLDNAVRYNKESGKVTISAIRDNMNIEARIEDTGIGIPEEQQNRLFTKFFRADNAVRISIEGSGLGLFIVKNIIEAHGGKIWLKSKENEGTAIWFTLPIQANL